MTLDQVPIGKSCKVLKIGGEGKIRRRIFDMGITPGTEIFLRKKATFGDPLETTLRGYELTIRKNEAVFVEVEPLDFDASEIEAAKGNEEEKA